MKIQYVHTYKKVQRWQSIQTVMRLHNAGTIKGACNRTSVRHEQHPEPSPRNESGIQTAHANIYKKDKYTETSNKYKHKMNKKKQHRPLLQ